jgi:biotin-dependent carboxylase-like uncharacterized protein
VIENAIAVERSGHAVVQDLGRPGHADVGIIANGASDQHSARTANILVGNADGAPVIEVTGSELTLVLGHETLFAVTGSADEVLIDGHRQPAWETLVGYRGARVTVPQGRAGLRSYVAVNGTIDTPTVLGSVAPDRLLGVGRQLAAGETVTVASRYRGLPAGLEPPLFRLGAVPSDLTLPAVILATPGPEIERTVLGHECLSQPYSVSAQSDSVGLRLLGPAIDQTSSEEILSRGVPIGAIEVLPTGGVIVLLRGRLLTAGYPVVGVVSSDSLDRLGQVRPGDVLTFVLGDIETAQAAAVARDRQRAALAERVRSSLSAVGLADVLDERHRSQPTSSRSGG